MPHLSLILVVKNGMPYVTEAVSSVVRQSYRDFELVVQDGASEDGTAEFFAGVTDVPGLDIVSEPDSGVGDAYARALRRCSGSIVGTIDADNLLEPRALEFAAGFIAARPQLAAAYGGSYMANERGETLYPWMPGRFDLLRLLSCELVPPFAVSFFSREVCGDELRFDETLKTCQDFDLWLRISHLAIERVDAILGTTRLSAASMTRRSETYEQYIADKTTALDRYFARYEGSPLRDSARRHALAGLHLWAAASVNDIEGRRTEQFEKYLARGLEYDPGSPRGAELADLPPVRVEEAIEQEEAASPAVPPVSLTRRTVGLLLQRARLRR